MYPKCDLAAVTDAHGLGATHRHLMSPSITNSGAEPGALGGPVRVVLAAWAGHGRSLLRHHLLDHQQPGGAAKRYQPGSLLPVQPQPTLPEPPAGAAGPIPRAPVGRVAGSFSNFGPCPDVCGGRPKHEPTASDRRGTDETRERFPVLPRRVSAKCGGLTWLTVREAGTAFVFDPQPPSAPISKSTTIEPPT
jgi:hypothetical protein